MKVTHELKSFDGESFFGAIYDGRKTFDVRVDDRRPRFAVGQLIRFTEHASKGPTGRTIVKKITFVQPGYTSGMVPPLHGIRSGYVGLGLGDPE